MRRAILLVCLVAVLFQLAVVNARVAVIHEAILDAGGAAGANVLLPFWRRAATEAGVLVEYTLKSPLTIDVAVPEGADAQTVYKLTEGQDWFFAWAE